jgi:hypothetical protein
MTCPVCQDINESEQAICSGCGLDLTEIKRAFLIRGGADSGQDEGNRKKGLARASLILGIISFITLGLLFIGAIIGTALGAMAISRIKRDPGQYGGRGMAIAGIVTSVSSIVIAIPVAIIAAIALPNMASSRQAAGESAAIIRLKEIDTAESVMFINMGRYANMVELQTAGLVDFKPRESGYRYDVRLVLDSYEVVATPEDAGSFGGASKSFYVSSDHVVRSADRKGMEASRDDPPIR